MAQKIRVELVDDISGGVAEETISFALDGITYEIDLSAKNAAELRNVMEPYTEAARRVGGRARAGRKKAGRSSADLNRIREWARANGYQVKDRGRIPEAVVQAYEAAAA